MGWVEQRRPYVRAHRQDFDELLAEQAQLVLSMWEQLDQPLAVAAIFDRVRWDVRLRERIYLRSRLTASDFGLLLAEELGGDFDPAAMDEFLASNARLSAEFINSTTEEQLQTALVLDEPEEVQGALQGVFDFLRGHRLAVLAASSVALSAGIGRSTAAEQSGARTKTWVVNSQNPRSSHARMSGQTVSIDEVFSNGMRWPGDPAIGNADELANCRCSVDFEV